MPHPELMVVITHYGQTRDEFASRVGKHRSCFEDRLRPLCDNGSYHAACTRVMKKVTCPVCRDKLGINHA